MKCADVRMVQRGDALRLALEPPAELGIGGESRGQHFDGDAAIQARVAGLVDFAHAAGAEERHDLVRTETHAWGEAHGRADYAISTLQGLTEVLVEPIESFFDDLVEPAVRR